MSPSDIELERKRKERDALAKKLVITKNKVAIAEMNSKIKLLENSRKQSTSMLEDNKNARSNDENQNTTSFMSSSSQKMDPNQSATNASTSNISNISGKNVANTPLMDLQRRPFQLEGCR